jgi:hypothetical protein
MILIAQSARYIKNGEIGLFVFLLLFFQKQASKHTEESESGGEEKMLLFHIQLDSLPSFNLFVFPLLCFFWVALRQGSIMIVPPRRRFLLHLLVHSVLSHFIPFWLKEPFYVRHDKILSFSAILGAPFDLRLRLRREECLQAEINVSQP